MVYTCVLLYKNYISPVILLPRHAIIECVYNVLFRGESDIVHMFHMGGDSASVPGGMLLLCTIWHSRQTDVAHRQYVSSQNTMETHQLSCFERWSQMSCKISSNQYSMCMHYVIS